jgi:two-component sensor histidine kinase
MNANNVLITRLEADNENQLNKQIIEHQERKIQRNKRKTGVIILVLSIMSLLIVLGSFYFRKSRKLNKKLKKLNSEILDQNKTIDKALQEKEVLLKEVHHRVKNSLQIISSLLNLQESQLTDEIAVEALRNSKTRIQTIALMHQSLYQKDADLGKVNSAEYLKNILELQMEALSSKNTRPKTKTEFEEQELSIDQAVPLGLIASELINNALKHAYIATDEPTLTLSTTISNGHLELRISDNGKGFESENFRNHFSLGLEIVEALNDQLRGKMTCESTKDGTLFTFLFPVE